MNDYEKRMRESLQNELATDYINKIYIGSGKNKELLIDLLNKLVEAKDRITYQNIILYYWQFIQDEKSLDINSYSEMTCEKEWKDYRGKIIFRLQDCGVENCWGEDEPDMEDEKMDEIRDSLISHAVEFATEELKKYKVFKKDADLSSVKMLLTHLSEEFESLNVKYCISSDGNIDEIAVVELITCLKMAISEPDMYYLENWREFFFNQRSQHNLEWAEDMKRNHYR